MSAYDYGYSSVEEMVEFFTIFVVVFLIVMLVVLAVSVVFYILQSLGLYTIAKRRQIKNPWMAWIPVANAYLLGCISDQYQHVAKNKTTNRRKWLLGLYITSIVVTMVYEGIYLSNFFEFFLDVFSGEISEYEIERFYTGTMLSTSGMSMLSSVVGIAYSVFFYIALYDLFGSCNPDNKVLYLVLTIFLGIQSILIFICRKRDDGMHRPVWMTGNWGQPQQPGQIPPTQEPWQ